MTEKKRKRKLPFGTQRNDKSKAISSYLIHPETVKRETKSEFLDFEIDSVNIKFPFVPYESQKLMMEKIIRSIRNSENALLESPTGTGKTLALLVAAIAWQKADMESVKLTDQVSKEDLVSPYFGPREADGSKSGDPSAMLLAEENFEKKSKTKIYFASRTQKQIQQVVRELERNTPYRPKMSILGSKEFYCIHKAAKNVGNKNEKCDELLELDECTFYHSSKKLSNYAPSIFDIEDLVKLGKKKAGCPYYAARALADGADIVFMPYNYLIDPLIRETCDLKLEGNIVILDEAHNIEVKDLDELLKKNWNKMQVMGIKDFMVNILQSEKLFTKVANVGDSVEASLKEFLENIDSMSVSNFKRDIEFVRIEMRSEEERQNSSLSFKRLTNFTMQILKMISQIFEFMFDKTQINDYKLVLSKKEVYDSANTRYITENVISIWCLNSSIVFNQLSGKCRSVILTSGTLSPLQTFAGELGTQFPEQLEAAHVINDDQLWIGCIESGPRGSMLIGKYQSYFDKVYQVELGLSLIRIAKMIPNGILVFMPSYGCLDKLLNSWKDQIIPLIEKEKVIFEEPRSGRMDFESLMNKYNAAASCDKGAILFCVQRGKMSEGIDFSDSLARAVICIGIPYPNYTDLRVKMKQAYNTQYSQSKNLLKGRDWYEIQAFRALNQSVGRCIRHKNDWGAIILLDARYKNKNVTDNLSKWLRDRVKSFPKLQDGCNSLKAFIALNTSRQPPPTMTVKCEPSIDKGGIVDMDIDQPEAPEVTDAVKQPEISATDKDNDENDFIIVTNSKKEPHTQISVVDESISSKAKKLSSSYFNTPSVNDNLRTFGFTDSFIHFYTSHDQKSQNTVKNEKME